MHVKFKFLIHWPDPPDRQNSMPMCSREKFRTKITVTEWPSSLTARYLTWASYKQHNTTNILLVSHHKELSALFLKVGVDGIVIKGLLRI